MKLDMDISDDVYVKGITYLKSFKPSIIRSLFSTRKQNFTLKVM